MKKKSFMQKRLEIHFQCSKKDTNTFNNQEKRYQSQSKTSHWNIPEKSNPTSPLETSSKLMLSMNKSNFYPINILIQTREIFGMVNRKIMPILLQNSFLLILNGRICWDLQMNFHKEYLA
jgi:hypothetical protein